MSGLTLYTYWRSSAAYRVRIALNLKQLSYESQYINLLPPNNENQQADYLQLNPQGLVPTLVHKQHSITQSLAIIEYLEENYPNHPLLPETAEERAFCRSLALIVACEIHPLNNLQVLDYLNERFKISAAAKNKWYQHWVEQGLKAMESHLEKTPGKDFCLSNHPSLADVFLIPQMYNAKRFGCNLSPYPRLRRIEENCLDLSAFKKARPENQADNPAP